MNTQTPTTKAHLTIYVVGSRTETETLRTQITEVLETLGWEPMQFGIVQAQPLLQRLNIWVTAPVEAIAVFTGWPEPHPDNAVGLMPHPEAHPDLDAIRDTLWKINTDQNIAVHSLSLSAR